MFKVFGGRNEREEERKKERRDDKSSSGRRRHRSEKDDSASVVTTSSRKERRHRERDDSSRERHRSSILESSRGVEDEWESEDDEVPYRKAGRDSPERKLERKKSKDEGKPRKSERRSRKGDSDRALPATGTMDQFPGMNTAFGSEHTMSGALPLDAHVSAQFPGQNPTTFAGPAFVLNPHGAAADYYNDAGQSVGYQPGVRPNTPMMLHNPDTHLITPSAAANPIADTGSGAAADFYSGRISPVAAQTTIGTDGPTSRPSKPSKTSAGVAGALTAAAIGGLASRPGKPSRHDSEPGFAPSGTIYSAPAAVTGKYDTAPHSNNTGLYTAAGAAAAGAAIYGMTHHPSTPQRPGLQHTHEHRSPMQKFKDGLLNLISDPDDVRKMEAYTEYIGVCKHCFDPRSSPFDGPRKHHYHPRKRDSFASLRAGASHDRLRRKSSGERIGMRIEKEGRYGNSRMSKAEIAALGAAGVATGAMLWGDGKDFDDTYSVKSGRRVDERRRSRSSSREHRRRTSYGTIKPDEKTKYVMVRTKDGRSERRMVARSRSRSRSRDKSALFGAAAGAALGTAALAADRNGKRRETEKVFVRRRGSGSSHSSRSRSASPGLADIFGFSSQPKKHRRRSPTKHRRGSSPSGGFNGAPKHKSKKDRGFFSFASGSASSSDSELAFGDEPRRLSGKTSRSSLKGSKRPNRRTSEERLTAAVAGIGATAAALAAAQRGQRITKRSSRPDLGARRHTREVVDGRTVSAADRDEWEDELPSDATLSSDSGLAFGEDARRRMSRQSMDSLASKSSEDGLAAWAWRWGGKKSKPTRRSADARADAISRYDELHRPSVSQDTSRRTSQHNPPSLQHIDPRPLSESGSIARKSSMPGAFDTFDSPPESRPGPAPLQQPQPITPFNPSFSRDGAEDPMITNKLRRAQTDPVRKDSSLLQDAALIGGAAIATAGIIATQGGRRQSNVRFGLTDEQRRKEDESRRREREAEAEEGRRKERSRQAKEEASRAAREEDDRRKREQEQKAREQRDREAAAARAAAEEERRTRILEEERRKAAEEERQRSVKREAEAREKARAEDDRRRREAQEKARRDFERREQAAREAEERERRQETDRAEAKRKEEAEERRRREEREFEEQEDRDRRRRDKQRDLEEQDRFDKEDRHRKKGSKSEEKSSSWEAPVAAGIAGAIIGAMASKKKTREVKPDTREVKPDIAHKTIEPSNEHSGAPILDDDLFDPNFFKRKRSQSETQRQDEKAADKVVADREAYYNAPAQTQAEIFAPAELLNREAGEKERSTDPMGGNEIQVWHAAEAEVRRHFEHPLDNKNFPQGFTHRSIPRLNVIAPTPPPASPLQRAKTFPENSPTDKSDDEKSPQRRQRAVSWGQDQTHVYQPQTPDSTVDKDSYVSPREVPTSAQTPLDDIDEIVVEEDAEDGTSKATRYSTKDVGDSKRSKRRSDSQDDIEEIGHGNANDTRESSADGFAKQAFHDTVSDMKFDVDSPGTEGAPPVRGWVEDEEVETPGAGSSKIADSSRAVRSQDEQVPDSPVAEDDWSHLSEKQRKKREKAAKRFSLVEDSPVEELGRDVQDTPKSEKEEEYFTKPLSKKEKKKQEKAAKRFSLADDEPVETPREVAEPKPEPEEEFFTKPLSKKDKKKQEKAAKRYSLAEEPTEPVQATPDAEEESFTKPLSKKEKKKLEKASQRSSMTDSFTNDTFTDAASSLPTAEKAEELSDSEQFLSKKEKKKRQKAAAQRALYDDEPDTSTPTSKPADELEKEAQPLSSKEKSRLGSFFGRGNLGSVVDTVMSAGGIAALAGAASASQTKDVEQSAVQTEEDSWSTPSKDKKKQRKTRLGESIDTDPRDIGTTISNEPTEVTTKSKRMSGMPGSWDEEESSREETAASDPDRKDDLKSPEHESAKAEDVWAEVPSKKSKKNKGSGAFEKEPTVSSPAHASIINGNSSTYDKQTGNRTNGHGTHDGDYDSHDQTPSKDSYKRTSKTRHESPDDDQTIARDRSGAYDKDTDIGSKSAIKDKKTIGSFFGLNSTDERRAQNDEDEEGDSQRRRRRRRTGSEYGDEDGRSEASSSGRRRRHHDDGDEEDYQNDPDPPDSERRRRHKSRPEDDQSFLGMRVEDLPPLPASRSASPAAASGRKEQDHGNPASAVALGAGLVTAGLVAGVEQMDEELPPLPPSEPGSPTALTFTPRSGFPVRPATSSTAVPLRFRPPPNSPQQGHSRAGSLTSPVEAPTQSPASGRQKTLRGRATEVHSGEFKPLYLAERHSKPAEIDDEDLPSLPSSKPSSRASSVHDTEDYHSAVESVYATPTSEKQLRIDVSLSGDTDILDSQQTTPRAGVFGEEEVIPAKQEPQFYTWEDLMREHVRRTAEEDNEDRPPSQLAAASASSQVDKETEQAPTISSDISASAAIAEIVSAKPVEPTHETPSIPPRNSTEEQAVVSPDARSAADDQPAMTAPALGGQGDMSLVVDHIEQSGSENKVVDDIIAPEARHDAEEELWAPAPSSKAAKKAAKKAKKAAILESEPTSILEVQDAAAPIPVQQIKAPAPNTTDMVEFVESKMTKKEARKNKKKQKSKVLLPWDESVQAEDGDEPKEVQQILDVIDPPAHDTERTLPILSMQDSDAAPGPIANELPVLSPIRETGSRFLTQASDAATQAQSSAPRQSAMPVSPSTPLRDENDDVHLIAVNMDDQSNDERLDQNTATGPLVAVVLDNIPPEPVAGYVASNESVKATESEIEGVVLVNQTMEKEAPEDLTRAASRGSAQPVDPPVASEEPLIVAEDPDGPLGKTTHADPPSELTTPQTVQEDTVDSWFAPVTKKGKKGKKSKNNAINLPAQPASTVPSDERIVQGDSAEQTGLESTLITDQTLPANVSTDDGALSNRTTMRHDPNAQSVDKLATEGEGQKAMLGPQLPTVSAAVVTSTDADSPAQGSSEEVSGAFTFVSKKSKKQDKKDKKDKKKLRALPDTVSQSEDGVALQAAAGKQDDTKQPIAQDAALSVVSSDDVWDKVPKKLSKKEKRKAKNLALAWDEPEMVAEPVQQIEQEVSPIEAHQSDNSPAASGGHDSRATEMILQEAANIALPDEEEEELQLREAEASVQQQRRQHPHGDSVEGIENLEPLHESIPTSTSRHDLAFAASLAAGLAESGFNPDLVVDDPLFHRRSSPTGRVAEAVPEEAERLSPKPRNRRRKSRSPDLATADVSSKDQDLASRREAAPANDDFDNVVAQGLQTSGFDPSFARSSVVQPAVETKFVHTTSDLKPSQSRQDMMIEPSTIRSSTSIPAVEDQKESRRTSEKSVDRESFEVTDEAPVRPDEHFYSATETSRFVNNDSTITEIRAATDSLAAHNPHDLSTIHEDKSGSSSRSLSTDPGAAELFGGDKEMDVDEMDKAYRQYKKNKRKAKKQKYATTSTTSDVDSSISEVNDTQLTLKFQETALTQEDPNREATGIDGKLGASRPSKASVVLGALATAGATIHSANTEDDHGISRALDDSHKAPSQPEPSWSFSPIEASQRDFIDKMVQDRPRIRDSGYQSLDTPLSASVPFSPQSTTSTKTITNEETPRTPLRVDVDADPNWTVRVTKRQDRSPVAQEAVRSRTPSGETSLESTTRNRASHLFQSPPELAADIRAGSSPRDVVHTASLDSQVEHWTPDNSPSARAGLQTIAEETAGRHSKTIQHDASQRIASPHGVHMDEQFRRLRRSPEQGHRSISSPLDARILGTGSDLSSGHRRVVSDIRSQSALSNRSNGSAGIRAPEELRSFSRASSGSAHTGPHVLRRTSMSGNLRAASQNSLRGSTTTKTITFDSPPTPPSYEDDELIAPGASRAADMGDVFQGYGGRQESHFSPTRPPSVRKRQSMHILELESRLDQLAAENRALSDAREGRGPNSHSNDMHAVLEQRELELREKDAELHRIQAMLQPLQMELSRLKEINDGLTEANRNLVDDTNGRYATLQAEHEQAHQQWQSATRELDSMRSNQVNLASNVKDALAGEISIALAEKDNEIRRLREELEIASEQIRSLQVQLQSQHTRASDFLTHRDEDYFDGACQRLCQHAQQWVLRFSKSSDNRICRLSTELNDDKIEARLDNAILDGSDVDKLLGDRVKRRDVFMSVVTTMIWEYVFTRYLFGMDREQRQKLKTLEKTLSEVGPPRAVAQWRATTLTLLSKRESFAEQCDLDTEAVAHEIYNVLASLLPPPQSVERQLIESLQRVVKVAVDLSIEMRTQRAEFIMLPPLQPEYDSNGELVRKVHFNAALMNERSGLYSSNEELAADRAVVKLVLFPPVIKKGDDFGDGAEELVVCPSQVLVHNDGGKARKVVRVMSGAMNVDDGQSFISTVPGQSVMS